MTANRVRIYWISISSCFPLLPERRGMLNLLSFWKRHSCHFVQDIASGGLMYINPMTWQVVHFPGALCLEERASGGHGAAEADWWRSGPNRLTPLCSITVGNNEMVSFSGSFRGSSLAVSAPMCCDKSSSLHLSALRPLRVLMSSTSFIIYHKWFHSNMM